MKKKYESPQTVVVATTTEDLLGSSNYIPVSGGTVRPKAPLRNTGSTRSSDVLWSLSVVRESLDWVDREDEEYEDD